MLRSLTVAALIAALPVAAQIAHGGQPIGWGHALPHTASLPVTALSPLDRGTLIAQEQPGPTGARFGTQRFLDVDVLAQGQWSALPDDRRVCRYAIVSPGAVMMSLQFDRFQLAPDAWVYLYNARRTFFIGGFNADDELPTGDWATQVLPGDSVIIEYVEPVPSTGTSELRVGSITHGYRDIFHFGEQGFLRDYDPGYQSSACNNNVICPLGANWQTHKRSVGMFLRPDGSGCSGVLLNNTATPGRPFFHVAAHCYTNTESQWVFYFNYESPTCVGSTGPTTQTITGATKRASDYFADFILLELSSTPPASYTPYYAGWDHSGATPQSGTVIHHPLFDVKKITVDNNPATSYAYSPYTNAPDSVRLWKCFWESGIVEPVSSGSPLFDQNQRMVGHMNDGAQTCANATTVYTGCAKFSECWDGASSTNRERDWLDPNNTAITLNGYSPSTPLGVRVKAVALLEGPYSTGDALMLGTLRANGLVPTTEPYTGLGYTHVNGGGGETTTAGVLAITGSSSVVDWVVVELRNKNNAAVVQATKSALILRNGNIVAANDGVSDVYFSNMPADDYYIAIRHRNHLGIMTQNAQALTSTGTTKNFSNGSLALYGGTAATKAVGTKRCMFAGEVVRDNILLYTGANNDRDPILSRVGGTVPTNTVNGYYREDVNLDGTVKYTGLNNDRDPILVNVGGTNPNGTRAGQLP